MDKIRKTGNRRMKYTTPPQHLGRARMGSLPYLPQYKALHLYLKHRFGFRFKLNASLARCFAKARTDKEIAALLDELAAMKDVVANARQILVVKIWADCIRAEPAGQQKPKDAYQK